MSVVCCGSSFARAARQQPSQHARRRHVPRRAAVIHDQVPPTPRSDLAQSSSAPAHHPTIVCVDVPSRLADYIDALCVRHGLLCDPALQQAAAARYARSGRALGAPEVGCVSDALVATRERRNREVERARVAHCTVCRAVRALGAGSSAVWRLQVGAATYSHMLACVTGFGSGPRVACAQLWDSSFGPYGPR